MASDFDDAPKWYWAAGDGRSDGTTAGQAGDRFVIASGQRELWHRVRLEIDPREKCSWDGFGPKTGEASLADCMYIFLKAREVYGVNYNRLVREMAQVTAFAEFIKAAPGDLCNWISNPISEAPLKREAYAESAERALGDRVAETLGLEMGWWK